MYNDLFDASGYLMFAALYAGGACVMREGGDTVLANEYQVDWYRSSE
jgi:hypothetical protein